MSHLLNRKETFSPLIAIDKSFLFEVKSSEINFLEYEFIQFLKTAEPLENY